MNPADVLSCTFAQFAQWKHVARMARKIRTVSMNRVDLVRDTMVTEVTKTSVLSLPKLSVGALQRFSNSIKARRGHLSTNALKAISKWYAHSRCAARYGRRNVMS